MSSFNTYSVVEDSGVTILGRVLGHGGSAVTQSDISSIAYGVYLVSSGSSVTTGSLTVATVIFDTLQNDDRWTADDTGYNFLWAAPVTIVPNGGVTYQVELTFTPTSGAVFKDALRLTTKALFGT